MQRGTDFMKAVHKVMKKICIFTHLNITFFFFFLQCLLELLTIKMSWNPSAITVHKFIKSKPKNQGDASLLHSFCMLFTAQWISIFLPSGNFCADKKPP